jgi:hypothetical protein
MKYLNNRPFAVPLGGKKFSEGYDKIDWGNGAKKEDPKVEHLQCWGCDVVNETVKPSPCRICRTACDLCAVCAEACKPDSGSTSGGNTL